MSGNNMLSLFDKYVCQDLTDDERAEIRHALDHDPNGALATMIRTYHERVRYAFEIDWQELATSLLDERDVSVVQPRETARDSEELETEGMRRLSRLVCALTVFFLSGTVMLWRAFSPGVSDAERWVLAVCFAVNLLLLVRVFIRLSPTIKQVKQVTPSVMTVLPFGLGWGLAASVAGGRLWSFFQLDVDSGATVVGVFVGGAAMLLRMVSRERVRDNEVDGFSFNSWRIVGHSVILVPWFFVLGALSGLLAGLTAPEKGGVIASVCAIFVATKPGFWIKNAKADLRESLTGAAVGAIWGLPVMVVAVIASGKVQATLQAGMQNGWFVIVLLVMWMCILCSWMGFCTAFTRGLGPLSASSVLNALGSGARMAALCIIGGCATAMFFLWIVPEQEEYRAWLVTSSYTISATFSMDWICRIKSSVRMEDKYAPAIFAPRHCVVAWLRSIVMDATAIVGLERGNGRGWAR